MGNVVENERGRIFGSDRTIYVVLRSGERLVCSKAVLKDYLSGKFAFVRLYVEK